MYPIIRTASALCFRENKIKSIFQISVLKPKIDLLQFDIYPSMVILIFSSDVSVKKGGGADTMPPQKEFN